MSFRKDDPIYYKVKITELIKLAKENDLEVFINKLTNGETYLSFKSKTIHEQASIKIEG